MNDLEIQLSMWAAFKNLFAIVQQQQQLITMTKERLDSLTLALQAQFEWQPPEQPPAPDPEMQSRVDAGLAELEKLIGGADKPQTREEDQP